MGLTNVSLTIKNPKAQGVTVREHFLVDSGASYTVLPERVVKKLKLSPRFKREFILADGKQVTREIGEATIKYGTEEITTPVVLGEVGDGALLGAITLESFGLALDPFQRKLYKADMKM